MKATESKAKEAQHTPGPWKAEHSGTGDASVIARPGWVNKDGSAFEPIIVKRTSWENARLIAAAPELLAALTDLVGGCGKEGDLYSSTAMNKARAAIAKATGRE